MLGDRDIERYARQVIVPGIGAAGQQRLLAATALVAGSPRGAAQASLYLRAAGMTVTTDAAAGIDVVVVADAGAVAPGTLSRLVALGVPLCWYAASGQGVDSGVHPASPLPSAAPPCPASSCVHDVAGADVAALACAAVLGLVR